MHKQERVSVNQQTRIHDIVIIALLAIVLLVAIGISLTAGRYQIPWSAFWKTIQYKFQLTIPKDYSQYATVLFDVRMPRVLTAVFIGAGLAISGTSYQSMFKNPMVSPDILGVSTGAGFGAALGILIGASYLEIQGIAFLFGLIAVGLSYLISQSVGRTGDKIIVLVLSGMVIRTVFQAFISITKYLADPEDSLPEITFWLMGSLSSVTLHDTLMIGIPTIVGIICLLRYRWILNIMAFGEEEAASLGVDTKKTRNIIILISTLMVSVSISVCGAIGWVGLIIPHFTRMIVGPDNKLLMPVSIIIGSIYLLVMDDIARNLMQVEVPISIMTSIVGAPIFVFLLIRTRRTW